MISKLSELFYGWRMVGLSAAMRVLGAGLHSFGFAIFFLPLSQDLKLSRTATSFAFSLARAEGAIEGPVVGHILDRYGPRPVMFTAILLMGFGYLLLTTVDSYAMFLVVYLGMISISHAGGFMHAPIVLVNSWFIRQRARAITLNSAAFSLGGVLIAPILIAMGGAASDNDLITQDRFCHLVFFNRSSCEPNFSQGSWSSTRGVNHR